MSDELFPRPPRRMKQPPKDVLREQLALAADEIEFWRTQYQSLLQRTGLRRLFPLRVKFKPKVTP